MKKIECVNSFGIKGTFSRSWPYFLEKYEGIHERIAELQSVSSAFSIGELYIGENIQKRNIILYGWIKDNLFDRRQFLYNLFPSKDEGTLYFYEKNKSFKINYRVDSISIPDDGVTGYYTISLICMNPYFSEVNDKKETLSEWVGGIEFPLEFINDEIEFEHKETTTFVSIENPTPVNAGLKIVFTAEGRVKNPTLKNMATQESLTVNFEMEFGDVIEITTFINDKNIILKRNGQEENINNYLLYGTKFLELNPGMNNLKATADDGDENLITEINYNIYYEAI